MMPAIQLQARLKVARIDPLLDPRWRQLLDRHPDAGIFHTPAWLEALRRTYGYEPVVFTTAAPGAPLSDGVVFCRVRSWLTGDRLVSLPFSDHCQPLLPAADARAIWSALITAAAQEKRKYLEIRPVHWEDLAPPPDGAWDQDCRYAFHVVDLTPPLELLLRTFDDSCVRRRIRRAERAGLECISGRSPELIGEFFDLHAATRRRHGLPPQPKAWFANLAACLGDRLRVHLARHQGRPIAAIVTLLFRDTLTYKFGASDAGFHRLGVMPFLFWRAIEAGKGQGAARFDLGRSDKGNAGLIAFKGNWNAEKRELTYLRFPRRTGAKRTLGQVERAGPTLLGRLPAPMLTFLGRAFYRHLG
ncbi:MAG TPA: GNAT family N-acetyltransferase [Terriglobales bacterium]|nr:GNAT family N-acetyltransferase [Terriglobales bacterium]